MSGQTALVPRALEATDLAEVVRIDADQTGAPKPAYWEGVFSSFLGETGRAKTFGFGIDDGAGGLAGFLFAEVRAFEFGSEPCGWVFAVGIDDASRRRGHASALLEAATRRFRELGMTRVRTMVRRGDVPVLSFFRSQRFVGGPYVQLERDIVEGS